MSIFDVITNGTLGSVLNSVLQGGSPGSSKSGGFGGLGDMMGGSVGSILDTIGKQAKSAANTIQNSTPGGLGGLAGAGALGAILGGVLQGDLMKSVAMAGAGAVAWNFYKKWAAAQDGDETAKTQAHLSQTGQQTHYQPHAASHEPIPGFGDSAPKSASLPAKALDPTGALVMRAMIYAARADGTIDATEQARIDEILRNLLPGQDVSQAMQELRKETIDPAKVAAAVISPEQGEDVYRLSCSVIDIDNFMELSYLQALAAALGINQNKKQQLEAEAAQAKQQLMRYVQPA